MATTKKTKPSQDDEVLGTNVSDADGVNDGESPDTGENPGNQEKSGAEDSKPAKKAGPTDAQVEREQRSDIEKMKDYLASCPTTNFYIPLAPREKKGVAYETVTLNGYRLEIKKGMQVVLPVPVAQQLSTFLEIDGNVGEQYRVDKDTAKQEALS